MSLVPDTIVSLAEDDTIGGGKNIVSGASVNITKSTGGAASIFSDAAGTTAISLPTVTGSNGELKFWIAPGLYIYTVDGENYNVSISEPNDFVIENVSALASTPVVAGRTYYLKEYHAGTGYGGGELEAYTSADTPNNGTIFASGTVGVRLKRINTPILTVDHFGAKKDGTDSTAAIQAFIDAHPNGADVDLDFGVYTHFSTIYLRYQGIFLRGKGVFATDLKYVKAAGGTAIKANSTTAVINGAGFSGINFTADAAGTAPDITIDFSGFSYSVFENFEIYNPRVNGVLMKGYSDLGTAPYYNSFDKFRLFGGSDYTQTGILFSNGAWGGGSRGPNANMISNLMRGASLLRLIDLKEGQGNLFSNISGESINDHMIILNDIASYVDTGTATAGANVTLTDSGKAWTVNAFVNYSVTITGGSGVGQTRKITSNTATVLSVSPAWGVKLNGTSTYAISRLGAFENQFINLRQEGLNTLNPNFVTCLPGSLGNNISNYSVSSLGSGKTINDVSGHPSNHLSNGKYMFITEVIENPGASANINIWTKTSVLGGLGAGDSYSVEWMQVKCPGIVSGTATFTLDVGGVAVGGGSPTLATTLDSVLVNDAFVASTNKEAVSSLNNGLFLNITTDAAMNASTDFVVTVCVAVH